MTFIKALWVFLTLFALLLADPVFVGRCSVLQSLGVVGISMVMLLLPKQLTSIRQTHLSLEGWKKLHSLLDALPL